MSSPHGGIDDQIERLMQCKPLPEPEVKPIRPSLLGLRCVFARSSGIAGRGHGSGGDRGLASVPVLVGAEMFCEGV
jgi:hypothetical protein